MIPLELIYFGIVFAVIGALGFRRFIWFAFVQWFEGVHYFRRNGSDCPPRHATGHGSGQGAAQDQGTPGHSGRKYG